MPHPKPGHYIVYALIDPRTQEARYVGVTCTALPTRLSWHVSEARHKPTSVEKGKWIRALLDAGLRPEIAELERVGTKAEGVDSETFFIAYLRGMGASLLNVTHGGPGTTGLKFPDEWRANISAGLVGKTLGVKRGPRPEEVKAKISAAKKAKSAQISEASKRAWETRPRVHRPVTDEARARMSAAQKRRHELGLGYVFTDEVRERMSQAQKRRWARES